MNFISLKTLRPIHVFIFFAVLSFVTYRQSLSHEFMLDDHAVLLAKEPGIANIGKALDYTDESHVFFRPVTNLFRLFLISTFPKDPVYYHAVNILLFAGHLSLVFLLLTRLFKNFFAPWITCVLFALHPVNSAFINYMTGHEILLFGIFLDLSALFLLNYFEDPKKPGHHYLSILFFVLALFTQEISIGFLFFVVLLLLQFQKGMSLRQSLKVGLPYIAVASLYVLFRVFWVSHTAGYVQRMFDYAQTMRVDVLTYINTVFELIGWYAGQLIIPSQIVLIKTMPAQSSGSIVKLAALGIMCVLFWFVFRKTYKENKLLFAVLWFLTGFIPVFGLVLIYPYGGFVIEPHWFFFSSMGFFLIVGLLSDGVLKFFSNNIRKGFVLGAILILACVWYSTTQSYNHLWRSQESYCRYWLTVAPDFYFPNFWLARDLFKQNKLTESEYHYKKAFIGKKNDWLVYAGRVDIEAVRSNFLKAREYYLEAVKLKPDSAFLHKNVKWLDQRLISDKISR